MNKKANFNALLSLLIIGVLWAPFYLIADDCMYVENCSHELNSNVLMILYLSALLISLFVFAALFIILNALKR
jgi:hypothetical protein